MVELRRTIRFCISDGPRGKPDGADRVLPRDNTFAAWPPMRGLGRYYELDVTCRGGVDPQTGYFLNIKQIDEAAREHVLPLIEQAIAEAPSSAGVALGALLRQIYKALQAALAGRVHGATLRLCPTLKLSIGSDDMQAVCIRQQYEFAAAHRLHVNELSDDENREIFGKCNNPAGHGHNYQVELAVRCPIDGEGHVIGVAAIDAVARRHMIDKLDHKHLNVDVEQFEKLNPSVENIAQVIWQMLAAPIDGLGDGVALKEVSVWETQKTVCTYRGEPAQEKA